MVKRADVLPIVEEFYTIQGEGAQSGRAAYFIRLAGCDVGCGWCDAKYTWSLKGVPLVEVEQIVDNVKDSGAVTVVITGGEPLMHPLEYLTNRLHQAGVEILLETSGTHPLSGEFDWVCLSPKRKREPLDEVYQSADELKVVITSQEDFLWAEKCAMRVKSGCKLMLQPEWDSRKDVEKLIVEYVKRDPKWRISLQTHKYLDIP